MYAAKCGICGQIRKILIECSKCHKNICLVDFYIAQNLCADCMVIDYNEKYAEKIRGYAEIPC